MVALIIAIVLALLVFLFLFINHLRGKDLLIRNFRRCNVIVFGKKGTGKDLIFQAVINWRKKEYFSNINFGGKYNDANPSDLQLDDNDYHSFIHNNITIVDKDKKPFEKKDFYFSDCGIILPSQFDSMLHKEYKGFPLSYALSRHLWKNNIHANTQALSRVWKALREQADFYVRTIRTIKIFGLLITTFITYDKYESAEKNLMPLTSRMFNNYSKAELDVFVATNGEIHKRFIIQRAKKVVYDTREFHYKIFGSRAK